MTDPSPYHLAPGTILAETYRIEGPIGKGGMGEVYLASHARLSGRYAVKLLLREVGRGQEVLRRFKQEAEITSRLRHPNIVQVIDFAQMPDGTPFMVMEYLNGRDLADELRTLGRIPTARVVDLLDQVANGLAAAHAENIVHRDLKPANIFLTPLPGRRRELAKIVDFGISKVRAMTVGLTRTQTVIGTPQYMAPEQARGQIRDIDARTDQFALGAIAFEMLTGRPPFTGEDISSILYQIVHEPAPALVSLGFDELAPFDPVIARAMAKDRDARYPSVADFAQALADASRAPAPLGGWSAPGFSQAATLTAPGSSARQQTRPMLARPPPGTQTTLRRATGQLDIEGPAPVAPRRAPRIALALLGGAAIAVVGAFLVNGQRPAPTGAGAPEISAAVAAPSLPAAAPPAPPRDEPPPAPAEVSEVSIELDNGPAALRVAVDGRAATLPLRLPRGPEKRRIQFSAPGYKSEEQLVVPSKDLIIRLAMQKEAAPTPRPAHHPSEPRPAPTRKTTKNVVTDL
ncbi:MAG TPA: protein kinase [Polyangia bacterium]|jgi:serine/threonine-protein kinase|nr:protein kinase [Polyangia bacterium]